MKYLKSKVFKLIILIVGPILVFLALTAPKEYEVIPDPISFNADQLDMKQRPFIVDKKEYPFRSNWYERDGVSMHYIDEGEGIPVVLCHGNPEWSFIYRNLIKELSGEARLIAYDLPGCGFSELPDTWNYTLAEYSEWIASLIFDHLKLDKFIMVVQDWGGPTGLNVAVNNPDHVIGLVISNTWAWKIESGAVKYFSYAMRTPIVNRINVNRNIFATTLMRGELNKKASKNKNITDAYKYQFPTIESRKGTSEFPKNITRAGEFLSELEQGLPRLYNKDVEFIFGTKDWTVGTQDIINRWQSHFPYANTTILPEASHFTQEDSPESYYKALRNLLSSIK